MSTTKVTPDSVHYEIRSITPAIASEWLTSRTTARPRRNLSKATVARYARDMVRNKWIFTGEGLKFDADGQLLDGQHRLNAIVESDTTQQMLTITGLPADSHEGMDSGKARSPGDVLALNGHQEGRTLAAVARLALSVDISPHIARNARSWTTQEIKSRAERDPRMEQIVTEVLPELPPSLWQLTSRTIVGYVFYRFEQINPEAAIEFMHSLGTLAHLPEGSPILALHRRLTSLGGGRPYTRQWEAIAYFFMTWNAWRRGESRQHIRLSYHENRIRLVALES